MLWPVPVCPDQTDRINFLCVNRRWAGSMVASGIGRETTPYRQGSDYLVYFLIRWSKSDCQLSLAFRRLSDCILSGWYFNSSIATSVSSLQRSECCISFLYLKAFFCFLFCFPTLKYHSLSTKNDPPKNAVCCRPQTFSDTDLVFIPLLYILNDTVSYIFFRKDWYKPRSWSFTAGVLHPLRTSTA